jgi:hypothetical protein
MTIARRQIELMRLVLTHPGWTTEVLAHTLSISVVQATAALLTLQARGAIELVGLGWQKRQKDIRSWCRS